MLATHPHRKFVALLSVMLAFMPLALLEAQEAAQQRTDPPERAVRVLRVRQGDAEHISVLLRSFQVEVHTSDRLGLITVAGRPEEVAKAEGAVQEIERLTMRTPASAAQDVELTVHFLGIVDEDSSPPAGTLRQVVAELKKTFPFEGYKLLETIALRARVGEQAGISGLLPETLEEGAPPKHYNFGIRVEAIEPRQDSQIVRFNSVRASIRLPIRQSGNLNYQDIGINTALEVPDGKTVVVGKAGSVGESQGYLLVLTARVVN